MSELKVMSITELKDWHPPTPRCDTCGATATHAHLLPHDIGVERCEFACQAHDPGGYWFELSRWEYDGRETPFLEHLWWKSPLAVALVEMRLRGEGPVTVETRR